MKKKISIVIPCYYAERSIGEVVECVVKQMEGQDRFTYELILVNDGSEDGTFAKIREAAEKYPCVTGVDLAKNCGQHNAILAGMRFADGDYILGMDDDLQTHPSQIPTLIKKLEEGYDIVYGRYQRRHHTGLRNLGSAVNDLTIRWLIGKPKGLKACPMYIIRRFVRDEIIKSGSAYTNLQGLFLRSASRIANADIEHFDRKYGHSGYTLKKLIRLWSSFLNYSKKPIDLIRYAGFLVTLISAAVLILQAALAWGEFAALCGLMSLYFGILLFAAGLVGEYVARLFLAVTHEPQYVIRQTTRQEKKDVVL